MTLGDVMVPIVSLAVDTAIFTALHLWVKRLNRSADEIQAAPHFKPGPELLQTVKDSDSGCLAYASVEGEVMAVNQLLASQYVDGQMGVMKEVKTVEHKSKRLQGVWSDVKNTIQDRLEVVPFVLRRWMGKGDDTEIQILEPTEAKFLLDDLTTTHDHFEPNQAGVFSRGMDQLFGEVTKGVHRTERLLPEGTILLGVGEIALMDDKLQLRPPQSGAMFVLTKMSKAEVIKKLLRKSFWVRVFEVLVGLVGTCIATYLVRKYYKKWQHSIERTRIIRDVRRLREQNPPSLSNTREADSSDEANSCVVCLANRREIVLLDCGHLCLCAECLTALPEPLSCPVCRQTVVRWVTTYNP